MPVCSIVKLLPLGTVDDLMHYCIRSSTAPRGNSFDYTTNRHEVTVKYTMEYLPRLYVKQVVALRKL